jgi:serine/tyrosine/threonine adenylyltransferase
MMGAGQAVDDKVYVDEGVKEEQEEELVNRAQKLITQAGEEYKAVFLAEYRRLMARRIGILHERDEDLDEMLSPLLELLEKFHLDFNHFFRRLSSLQPRQLETEEQRRVKAAVFFHREGATGDVPEEEQRKTIADWLGQWRRRVLEDRGADLDDERSEAMKRVNPNFVPRGWILDEVIRRVEKQGERAVLARIMNMSLHPFEDTWHGRVLEGAQYEGDQAEEARWTEDPPIEERAIQCSCSS